MLPRTKTDEQKRRKKQLAFFESRQQSLIKEIGNARVIVNQTHPLQTHNLFQLNLRY